MAQFKELKVTLAKDSVAVGYPTAQTVRVVIPNRGEAGPQGPQGPKGDPGDVAGAVEWDNVTDKPATFPPSAHSHVAADVTDFNAAVAAVAPPTTDASLLTSGTLNDGRLSAAVTASLALADTASQPGHTHTASQVTDFSAAAAAAAPVQSVAGRTGTVTLAVADVASAVADTDARLSDARTPTSHTHGNLTNDGKVGSTSGLPLKTGTDGVVEAGAFGTSAGQFAEGNHTHAQLHDRSHAMTSASDHTAGNWKLFHSNGSGEIVELALGDSGKVLTSNGAAAAPTFEAASGGGGEVRSDFVSPYTYIGLANAGTSESTAAWLIRRSEFDADGSYISTTTATAVKWDDRLTASYS